ncbi:MAG TPA: hypothetical protein DCY07_00635 [Rhodospirillaceae bacterium]|nr:hypothetical protein [Rhodospirillaceae bacterium]
MSGNLTGATAPDATRDTAQNAQLTPTEKYEADINYHRKEVARIVKAVEKNPRYDYKAPERPITVAGKKPPSEKHDYQ